MKKLLIASTFVGLLIALAAAILTSATTQAADKPVSGDRIFELRTYVTFPGKLEDLHKRFRDHTCRLFQKHGIELVGFWTPAEGPESKNTLIYIVAFPSVEAQKKAWKSFFDDPEWKKVKADSEKDGALVKEMSGKNLKATDYSPIK